MSLITQIQVHSLAFVHYQHPDLEKSLSFFTDFGLVEEDRQPTKAFLRGNGSQPYVYLAEQSPDSERHFIGAYWNCRSARDLENATTLPGASAMGDLEGPGGGKVVRVRDPHGFVVGFLFGQTFRNTREDSLRLELTTNDAFSNTAEEKLRKGPVRRFKHGPSPIHKLGHYGIGVPAASYTSTMDWYRSVINLKPTDAIFDPKTEREMTCFNHIDLGEEYTDHHVSAVPFLHLRTYLRREVGEGYLPQRKYLLVPSSSRPSSSGPLQLPKLRIRITAVSKSMISTPRSWVTIG